MDGKVALKEPLSTPMNNAHWNAAGEEERNGNAYAQDVERRLLDPELRRRHGRAGIEFCILSLTSLATLSDNAAAGFALESRHRLRTLRAPAQVGSAGKSVGVNWAANSLNTRTGLAIWRLPR
jgi:hypothetical protein